MHSGQAGSRRLWRFGSFELDESAGELRRNGSLIHLPPQPLQILKLLLGNAGDVIDRESIRREVWGDTAVDFDRSLNVAIAQIRSVLNDDAVNPRFVQTVPRRGYRFLAEVATGEPRIDGPAVRRWPRLAAMAVLGIVLAAALLAGAIRWQASGQPIRIAVLPFDKLSLDPPHAVRAEAIFDDLLTALGGIQPHRIEVIGRRSVSNLKDTGQGSIRDLGKRLNVNYVLESSMRGDGDSVRVSARLVDSGTETVRWSASFQQDRPGADFEEIVVSRISAGVLSTLFPAASPGATIALCRDGEEAFDTGRMLVNRGGLKDLEQSLGLFQQAGCGQALAYRAEVLVRLGRIGNVPGDHWEPARSAARSALNGNKNLALAHLALGNVAFWHDWNWAAAEREFREALRIDPSDPDAHHDLAWLETALGRRGDAMASLETAIALDPLSARTRMDSAWLFLQLGQFRRAASEARRALELNPGLKEARYCISRALLYAGDAEGALESLKPAVPQSLLSKTTALPAADALHRVIEYQTGDADSDSYQRAWQLAFLGSRARALAALEEGYAKRSPMMPLIAADPAFRTLRDDARFQAIRARMGL